MEASDPFAIRLLIKNELELCTDIELLDLIYKLLLTDKIQ